jgi:hypothetical protein
MAKHPTKPQPEIPAPADDGGTPAPPTPEITPPLNDDAVNLPEMPEVPPARPADPTLPPGQIDGEPDPGDRAPRL